MLPNRFLAEYRECFVIAAGYGDISSERAYLRTELLSCVRPNGDPLEVKIQGSVFGEDGKVGMRGRLVTKQGQMLANALLAGVVSGIGQGFSQANTTYSTSPLGSVATASGGDAYRAAPAFIRPAEQVAPSDIRSLSPVQVRDAAMRIVEATSDAHLSPARKAGVPLACGHQERVVFQAMGLLDIPEQPLRLEAVRRGTPSDRNLDVSVVLDLMMPNKDGLETLREIRKRYPRLPVIMFSTLTERGATATLEALALGASDYVTKPANVGSVTAAMDAANAAAATREVMCLVMGARLRPRVGTQPEQRRQVP